MLLRKTTTTTTTISAAAAAAAAPSTRLLARGGAAAAGRATRASGRALSTTARTQAVSKFAFPAMSPTMTEGGIANWKLKEGDAFNAGDVLLEIETDKATMDVEAQEDGVLGKIILGNGTKEVPVGKVIALLAEEGDDISNLEVPAEEGGEAQQQQAGAKKEEKEEKSTSKAAEQKKEQQQQQASSASASSSAPTPSSSSSSHSSSHSSSGAIFPSVARLLAEHHLSASDVSSGKGTGVRGMLTKGDVLAHLGLAPGGPQGTLKADPRKAGGIASMYGQGATPSSASASGAGAAAGGKDTKPLGEDELRRLIIAGLAGAAVQARAAPRSVAPEQAPAAPAQATSRAKLDRQYASLLSGYSFQKEKKAGPTLPQGAGAGAGGKKGANPFAGLL